MVFPRTQVRILPCRFMPISVQLKQVSKKRNEKPEYKGKLEKEKTGVNRYETEFYGWITQVKDLKTVFDNIEEDKVIVSKPNALSEKDDVDYVVKIFDQRL